MEFISGFLQKYRKRHPTVAGETAGEPYAWLARFVDGDCERRFCGLVSGLLRARGARKFVVVPRAIRERSTCCARGVLFTKESCEVLGGVSLIRGGVAVVYELGVLWRALRRGLGRAERKPDTAESGTLRFRYEMLRAAKAGPWRAVLDGRFWPFHLELIPFIWKAYVLDMRGSVNCFSFFCVLCGISVTSSGGGGGGQGYFVWESGSGGASTRLLGSGTEVRGLLV